MKTATPFLTIAIIFIACGENKKEPSQVEPAKQPVPGQVGVNDPTPSPAPAPLKTAEEVCNERADDFDWIDGRCKERPNFLMIAQLDITSGTIWAPNSENCTRVYGYNFENRPKSYQRCAGVDVTIPLVKPTSGRGINKLRLGYNCSMPIHFPAEVNVERTQVALFPRKDDTDFLVVETPVDADSNLSLSLKFVPDYTKIIGAQAVKFPETCKILLIENSATNVD